MNFPSSYVVRLNERLNEGALITALVFSVDGNEVNQPFEIKIKVLDQFIRRGGWEMYNALIESTEVVIEDKGEHYHTQTARLYFEPHNTAKKVESV